MCGICGYWDSSKSLGAEELSTNVRKMSNSLIHRGPDDEGIWVDEEVGIALGNRRLSIIDLSSEGHQPMLSADGRYVIAYNGEIYNFRDLRKDLEKLGHHCRGHSDTEVMLASFCEWGVQESAKRFNGMFAFALWDRVERILHLGRDRIGEKPLYYGWQNGTFLFGSELKALKAKPGFRAETDRNALTLYLRYNYIPAPYSIYQNIHKLLPGHLLTISSSSSEPEPLSYWSARTLVESGLNHPFKGTDSDAISELDSLLRDSIKLRMISDVPLGAFLSGGVDSSTIVALMQAQSNQPVKTFTIGFHEDSYNEAQYAKTVAEHLGTDHTEFYLTPKETMDVIPRLPSLYDEPFSDSSQIPTFLISQLARQRVKVALSGDGGDELFAGYSRHLWGNSSWKRLNWIPQFLRRRIASIMKRLSVGSVDSIYENLEFLLPESLKLSHPAEKIRKLSDVLDISEPAGQYRRLVSNWAYPKAVVAGAKEPSTIINDDQLWQDFPDVVQTMMYLDLVTYHPDDILVKLDRASMGVSLEAREPYLDHRVVEFAWRVPLSLKIREGQGKWLLRHVLYQYVPPDAIERPKTGFEVPIDKWLRNPLRDWAESLLDRACLKQQGYFNPNPIHQKWREHLDGKRNWQYQLWNILMFQSWLESEKQ
ncbi:MAG: asparagine synthase (glutamine-hydrolyzing) [Candidatus Neomarinimicrobiota bacterium]